MATDLVSLDFDSITPASIKAETKTAIQTALTAQGLEIDLREGSYTDALLSEGAAQVYKAYMLAQSLLAAAVPSEDGGTYLDSFAQTFGLDRTAGSQAEVQVTFTGTAGAAVAAGTWVCTASGLRFETQERAFLAAGEATVAALAEESGALYNVEAGEIVHLQTSLAGITAVTNPAAAVGGADAESDRTFYSRLHLLLSQPVASGNANHYKQWALAVNGVGYAAVQPLWNGAGTVRVIVATEDKQPVGEDVRLAVAAHIEEERPIGASVTVANVETVAVHVTATVTLESGSTETVATALKTAMAELFGQWEIGTAAQVRKNRILALLLNITGVVDYSALTVTASTGNLYLSHVQVPVCGTVTIMEG